MRKFIVSLLFGLILSMTLMAYAGETQKDIAAGVVRLHIIANSDSDTDQQIKLKVRDAVCAKLAPLLENVTAPSEAKRIISANLDTVIQTADSVLCENGFSYRADAAVGESHFPVKRYENIMLPPGKYDALRVVLGNGSGQNWWCVMYPPLCFEGSVQGYADNGSTDTLKENLGEENYALVTDDGSLPVVFKFKILEIFDSIYK